MLKHRSRSRYVFDLDSFIRALILLGFIIMILSLIGSEQLTLYIHPKFAGLVELANYLLLPLLAAQLLAIFRPAHPLHQQHSHNSRWTYLPFVIVLALAFGLPNHTLNANLVSTKGLNSQAVSTTNFEMSRPLADALRQAPVIDVTDKDYTEIMNELQFFPQDYIDKEISMTGFVFKAPKLAPNQFSLVRYVVVCCTADALPYGILCQLSAGAGYEEGTWLTVKGRIRQASYEDKMVAAIQITSIKKIPEPEKPYVFPPG